MKYWPKPEKGWLEYLRVLPSFAAMAVAVMFLIDWYLFFFFFLQLTLTFDLKKAKPFLL